MAYPTITYLRIQNYRALRDVTFHRLTPLTVWLGPNGSGKSTVFDSLAFLAECFAGGLRKALNRRGRLAELRTREQMGPIEFEVRYREGSRLPLLTYTLRVDEEGGEPVVVWEELKSQRRVPVESAPSPDFQSPEAPAAIRSWPRFRTQQTVLLSFSRGQGYILPAETFPGSAPAPGREADVLSSAETLAVNAFGQLKRYPQVAALRAFITRWYFSYLSVEATRTGAESGISEHLSADGDNLPSVVRYLQEYFPAQLATIEQVMGRQVPGFEALHTETLPDGRLRLTVRDRAFQQPVTARFTSDGALKLLAYLTLFYDPIPPQLLVIEEPENHLHPMLLREFTQECQQATARSQVFITTHSPFILNDLRPEQVWVLYRNEQGHTQAVRAADIAGVEEFVADGASLGYLWLEGSFGVGDPRRPYVEPRRRRSRLAGRRAAGGPDGQPFS